MLRAIFARHARPARNATENDPVSEQYPDLTEEGVRQAKGVGDYIWHYHIKNSRKAFLIAATSDQPRTKQTTLVMAETIKTEICCDIDSNDKWRGSGFVDARHYDGSQDDGLVPIEQLVSKARIDELERLALFYPVYVAEFGYGYHDRWTYRNPESGKQEKTRYFATLLEKYSNDHAEALYDWLATEGLLKLADGTTLRGPEPLQVAKDYLQGLISTHHGMELLFPDREVVVVAVGHQWDLDALATYLATGQVTYDAWRDVMGRPKATPEEQVIGECELLTHISYDPETGASTVTYRGRDFDATIAA